MLCASDMNTQTQTFKISNVYVQSQGALCVYKFYTYLSSFNLHEWNCLLQFIYHILLISRLTIEQDVSASQKEEHYRAFILCVRS